MKLNINIPESLNEIQLGQWQNYAKIEEPNDYDVLRCFYGIDTKGVFKMKDKDVNRLVLNIKDILETEVNDLVPIFNLGGQDFGFIPKLDDMTYGENNDLSTYVNDIDNAHRAMAVMYRPVLKQQFGKYLIEEYEGSGKYAELMRKAPLSAYISSKVFFYNLTNDLLNYIPTFIREESQQHTGENGATIQHYADLLETTLADLTRYQRKMYISA